MRKTHLPSIHSWHEVKISDHLWSQRPTITGDTFSRGQVTKVRQFTQPNISRSRQGVWVPLFHGKRTMVNQDFIISRVQPAFVFLNSFWSFLETCPSWKAWRSISCTLLLYLCSREKLVCFAHHYICAGRSSKFCNCLSPLPDYVARNVTGENHDHVFFLFNVWTKPGYKHLEVDVPAPAQMSLGAAPIVSLAVKVGVLHCPGNQK